MPPPPLPIRFTGHFDIASEGKFLWEILCQLRNMGVGRYVTKNEWSKKWPHESSYLKIVKARPEMDRWQQKGKLWAEWTFRGHHVGVCEFAHDLNRSDWRLIHRHEEKALLNNKKQMRPIDVAASIPLPPLEIHLAKKQAAKSGKTWTPADERMPNELCVDPQFEFLRPLMRMVEPDRRGRDIYEEADPSAFLDLYGELLPRKVEAWMLGPAAPTFTFQPASMEKADKK